MGNPSRHFDRQGKVAFLFLNKLMRRIGQEIQQYSAKIKSNKENYLRNRSLHQASSLSLQTPLRKWHEHYIPTEVGIIKRGRIFDLLT